MNIVVRRTMALGDVLCVTPILTRLRQENPDFHIVVETGYPNVFQGNLCIDNVNKTTMPVTRRIDLDMAHETRRYMHAIDAYMEVAFGDRGEGCDKSIVFEYDQMPDYGFDWRSLVTVHANASWPNRTMPNAWWDKVSLGLVKAGYRVMALGTHIDYLPAGAADARGTMDLRRQATAIAASRVFICGASGLFILAAATPTPVVVPLTINTPDTALPWRHGVQGAGFFPLVADVSCIGCSERAGPVTSLGCERAFDQYACIPTINPGEALTLALGAARDGR